MSNPSPTNDDSLANAPAPPSEKAQASEKTLEGEFFLDCVSLPFLLIVSFILTCILGIGLLDLASSFRGNLFNMCLGAYGSALLLALLLPRLFPRRFTLFSRPWEPSQAEKRDQEKYPLERLPWELTKIYLFFFPILASYILDSQTLQAHFFLPPLILFQTFLFPGWLFNTMASRESSMEATGCLLIVFPGVGSILFLFYAFSAAF